VSENAISTGGGMDTNAKFFRSLIPVWGLIGLFVIQFASFPQSRSNEELERAWAPILGAYEFDMSGEGGETNIIRFLIKEGALWGMSPDGDEFEFEPVANETFAFEGEDELFGTVSVTFSKDPQGEYNICHFVVKDFEIDVKGIRTDPDAGQNREAPVSRVAQDQPGPKNAEGTFTFNGKPIAINYGFAWYESSALDDTVTNIHLVFTDHPVPPDSRSIWDLQDLGEEGKIHGFMAVFATGGMFKDSIVGGTVYHEDVEEMSLAFSGGNLEVETTTLDESVIEGRVFTTRVQRLFDYEMELDVTFKVPLPEKKQN
jgi:hypothetical protein